MEYLFYYLCRMKPKDPEKEQIIYETTLQLVRQNGLTGLTMAELSKVAKLGMGTIYVYFKSKEELINSLFKRLKRLNTSRIYASLDEKAPFAICLQQLYENYLRNRVRFYEEHFFIEQCVHSHFLDQEAVQLDLSAYQSLHELLNRGKTELLVKNIQNELLIAHLMGSANEIANLALKSGQELSQTWIDQAFVLCWDSIRR